MLWILNPLLYLTWFRYGSLKHLSAFTYAWAGYVLGLLGSVAPCVLYGSNMERLHSNPGTFGNHCLHYSGLYVIGNSCFGWNCLAPWLSYHSRTEIRRRFNLEVSYCFIICLLLCHETYCDLWWGLRKNCSWQEALSGRGGQNMVQVR